MMALDTLNCQNGLPGAIDLKSPLVSGEVVAVEAIATLPTARMSQGRAMWLLANCLTFASILFVMILYALHAAIPYNPLVLPFEDRSVTQGITPEGWAFFTSDARAKKTFAYVKRDGRWAFADDEANSRLKHALGWDRTGRALDNEAYTLFEEVAKQPPIICRGTVGECVGAASQVPTIHNTFYPQTLCGNVAFVRRSPLPWAWAALNPPVVMPAEIRLADVVC